jgi:hypothetical protein
LSSLIILLANPAFALDCTGLDPDLCDYTHIAEDVSASYGVHLNDAHPNPAMRPAYVYGEFEGALADAAADCPSGHVEVEGVVAARWFEWGSWGGYIMGDWVDVVDGSTGPVRGRVQQSAVPLLHYGNPLGSVPAVISGQAIDGDRPDGFWSGVYVEQYPGRGYMAALYGACAELPPPPEPGPEVFDDHYEIVGNTPFVVGASSLIDPYMPSTEAPNGLLDNDPDAADLVVVGVEGCADTTAPFDCTSANGSMLSVNADGTFGYVPPPMAENGNVDSWGIRVERVGGSPVATSLVEFEQVTRVWYADASFCCGGNGDVLDPFSSLDHADGLVEDGDTLAIAGGVDAYSTGLTVSGDVRIHSMADDLVLDVSLNGQPAPVTLVQGNGVPAFLYSTNVAAITIDTDPGPASVHFKGFSIASENSPAAIRVQGANAYDVSFSETMFEYGTSPVVWVDQAGWGATAPSRLELRDLLWYNTNGIQIDPAGTGQTTVDIANVQMYDVDQAIGVQASGTSRLDLYLESIEGGSMNQFMAVGATDDAEVQLYAGGNLVDTNGSVFALDSAGSSRVGLTLAQNEFAMMGSSSPGLQLLGRGSSDTTVYMTETAFYASGGQAMAIQTAESGLVALTAQNILVSGTTGGPAIDARAGASDQDMSALCLQLDSVSDQGSAQMVAVSQQWGSDFYLGSPYAFDGQDPMEVQMVIEGTSGLPAQVDTQAPAVVDYQPVDSCGMPYF